MSWRAGHIDPVLREAIHDLNELVRVRLGPTCSVRVSIELTTETESSTLDDDLLNVEQTAELLGKAASTIRTMMQTDEIPAAKLGGTWYTRKSILLELVPTRR